MSNDVNFKNIDSLGRIVIPAPIRKKMGINQDTTLSFSLNEDSIILKKMHLLEENNNEVLLKILELLTECEIFIVNLEKIVLCSNKKYVDKELTADVKKIIEKRQKKLNISLQVVLNERIAANVNIYPIIRNSNLYGAIVVILQNSAFSKKISEAIELIVKLYTECCF